MSWLNKKTRVEEYEEEFRSRKLKQKHIFYDMFLTTEDPEEMRAYAAELIDDSDYEISVNKLTDFEDVGVQGIFRGGKLKPIRAVIKGTKSYEKGIKHSLLWKAFIVLGILAFVLVRLFESSIPYPSMFYLGGSLLLILGFITYMVKDKIELMIWLKFSGIYNVSDEKADIRVVLAGEIEKKDKEAIKVLDDDLNEIYQMIAKKYIKIKKKPKITIVKQETAETKIFASLREAQRELDKLNKRLIDQKISEETYKDIRGQLDKKKKNLETMMDLLGTVK